MARPPKIIEKDTISKDTHKNAESAIAQQVDDTLQEKFEDPDYVDSTYVDEDIIIDANTIWVPLGSKMLDIACSDTCKGGAVAGRYISLIGDSSSGKSILVLSMLAEMSRIPTFDNYRFIYDDAEEANSFNMEELFGHKLVSRLEPPKWSETIDDVTGTKIKVPINSDTIQDFQLHIFDAIDHPSKKPFIYILDSFDSITSKDEIDTVYSNMEARRKGNKETGSWGIDKPKLIGQILRMINGKLKSTNSFLVIISQTRDDINPMTRSTKTRSGGRALKFYASHEIWLATKGKLKKTALGHDRIIGVDVVAKITKNKLTGKVREVEFPIMYSYGVDDISACFDFIMSTEHWKKVKNTVTAHDLLVPVKEIPIEGTREKIIAQIEQYGLEQQLFQIANKRWDAIEEAVTPKRKSKFDN
jgi:RecA/RadA recombinase